jgi:hypothetical protein
MSASRERGSPEWRVMTPARSELIHATALAISAGVPGAWSSHQSTEIYSAAIGRVEGQDCTVWYLPASDVALYARLKYRRSE